MPTLTLRSFPARIADLGFDLLLPEDWIAHELPGEAPDFSDPTQVAALTAVTAPHAAIVFAVAARPAYEDGSLHDWAWYLLQQHGLATRAIGPALIGAHAGVMGEATQDSDLGTMVVRFAFLVDGGRLVNLTLTAPELLADAVRQIWFEAVGSFRLHHPQAAAVSAEVPAAEPASAPAVPGGEAAPAAPVSQDETAMPAGPAPGNDEPTFARYALAEDAASLDPEHRINANLRDRGVGLVPNVPLVDPQSRSAVVAAGALVAFFRVPLGWHVIDDGRRTLVFEPSGQVQINLDRIAAHGRAAAAVLDEIEAGARQEYPAPEFARIDAEGIRALGIRNIADREQAIEQYHMLVPGLDADVFQRARVTSVPARSADSCNLAQLILTSLTREPPQAARAAPAGAGPANDTNDGPEWWRRAQALEREERLEDAERVVRDAVQELGYAASLAELYRQRMHRLFDAGRREAAEDAYGRACNWISAYASMATSGGEGAALSRERDRFLAQLEGEFAAASRR